jgi:type II secretory pathway component PulF
VKTFFYEGIDASGRSESGRLTAQNANEAVMRLSSAGMQIRAIQELGDAPQAAPAPAAPAPSPRRTGVVPSSTSLAAPIGQLPTSLAPAAPAADPAPTLADWFLAGPPRGQGHFMALQLEPLLRAGHSPSHIMDLLADRSFRGSSVMDIFDSLRWPMTQAALRRTALETGAGDDLGESMARRPRSFPSELTGPLKAGAMGGYLPASALRAAEPIRSAQKFAGTATFFLGGSSFLTALAFLVAIAARQGMTSVLHAINDGNADTLGALGSGAAEATVTGGPWVLIFGGLLALGIIVLRSLAAKPFRHAWCAQVPPTRRRTRAENLREFAWHLSMLSKSGISPHVAWQTAAQTVPNQWWRGRLAEIGNRMPDGAKFTDIAEQSSLFSRDITGLLATGELTGTVDQALEHVSGLMAEDAQRAGKRLGLKITVWTMLVTFGGGVLAFAYFYSYLNDAYRIITPD